VVIHQFASEQAAARSGLGLRLSGSEPRRRNIPSSKLRPADPRVFGTLVFRASETVEMLATRRSEAGAARVRLTDTIWDALYEPIAVAVAYVADRLNRLQYLSIAPLSRLTYNTRTRSRTTA